MQVKSGYRIPKADELPMLSAFDLAFLTLTGHVRFDSVTAHVAKAARKNKDTVLWGPQARLMRHILTQAFKSEGSALLVDLAACFDVSGDISLLQNPDDVFKKHKDVGDRTWKRVEKKIRAAIGLIQRKASKEALKKVKAAAKADNVADAFMAEAMSDHIEAFTRLYPERSLHPEITRLTREVETNPSARTIDKGALATRLKNMNQFPEGYFANLSDVQAGRAWSYTELRRFQENQITRYQVTAQWDRRTCPVCQNLDGKIFEVNRAMDRVFADLSSRCTHYKNQKAAKPDYCGWFVTERQKIRDKMGDTKLPKPSIDPRGNYVRGRDGQWTMDGKAVPPAMIKKLNDHKLPPGWFPAIVAKDGGKIVATGLDDAGRWQARYSAEHVAAKAQIKHDRAKLLGRSLPEMRKAVMKDMMESGDPRAFLFHLEDQTAIRAGSKKDFKAKKKAYGLTTLQNEHVTVKGSKIDLKFVAKEGVDAHYTLDNPAIAKFLAERKSETKAGEALFPDVPAAKLNRYIQEKAGGQKFTLKDFRTYHGTRIAHKELAKYDGVELTPKQKKKVIAEVSQAAADFLHNTPTMARGSYINPMVWEIIGGL